VEAVTACRCYQVLRCSLYDVLPPNVSLHVTRRTRLDSALEQFPPVFPPQCYCVRWVLSSARGVSHQLLHVHVKPFDLEWTDQSWIGVTCSLCRSWVHLQITSARPNERLDGVFTHLGTMFIFYHIVPCSYYLKET